MGYIPSFTILSDSLVFIDKCSFYVGIGPIRDVDIVCIFRPISFVCMLDLIQV